MSRHNFKPGERVATSPAAPKELRGFYTVKYMAVVMEDDRGLESIQPAHELYLVKPEHPKLPHIKVGRTVRKTGTQMQGEVVSRTGIGPKAQLRVRLYGDYFETWAATEVQLISTRTNGEPGAPHVKRRVVIRETNTVTFKRGDGMNMEGIVAAKSGRGIGCFLVINGQDGNTYKLRPGYCELKRPEAPASPLVIPVQAA